MTTGGSAEARKRIHPLVASALCVTLYTGAWYRIRARQARKIARKKAGRKRRCGSQATMNDQHADRWLAPAYERQLPADQRYAEHGYRATDRSGLPMSLDQ